MVSRRSETGLGSVEDTVSRGDTSMVTVCGRSVIEARGVERLRDELVCASVSSRAAAVSTSAPAESASSSTTGSVSRSTVCSWRFSGSSSSMAGLTSSRLIVMRVPSKRARGRFFLAAGLESSCGSEPASVSGAAAPSLGPDADAGDVGSFGAEPASVVSARAVPWPVVTATLRPTANVRPVIARRDVDIPDS
ncbi:hypothetical protein [Mycolicibacterium mageritense]|uniref:hypothetical protein n=1 Tax=Mycolicibacterium mageritense TaxID=53462 RepID=UPI001E5C5691|nr:hypothetical protein [Mycolicibacterium mageritense]